MKYFFFITFCCLIFKCSYSQGHFPVILMEASSNAISNDTTYNGIVDFSDTTLFKAVIKIVVSDTNVINKLHVMLKSSPSDTIGIFSKTFNFDDYGPFSDGTSYQRSLYDIDLILGNFTGLINPIVQLTVELFSGQFTDPINNY